MVSIGLLRFSILCCAIAVSTIALAVQDPGLDFKIKHGSLIERAKELDKTGERVNAIKLLRQAVAMEDSLPSSIAGFNQAKGELAHLLAKSGKAHDAIELFARSIKWVGEPLGPCNTPLDLMAYAVALSMAGRGEDAKTAYYMGLIALDHRSWGSNVTEPVPFLIVFDPISTAVQWQYSARNLEVAAKMVAALRTNDYDNPALVREVKKLAPKWSYPWVFEASRSLKENRKGLLDTAYRLAIPSEKAYLEKYGGKLERDESYGVSEGRQMRSMIKTRLLSEDRIRRIVMIRG